ncbi:MAG TPA: hypothetical protein VGO97_00960 [Solirubrobacterales bacterium]|nr:hypothetical protein [Solirubrobacterales bacterium]
MSLGCLAAAVVDGAAENAKSYGVAALAEVAPNAPYTAVSIRAQVTAMDGFAARTRVEVRTVGRFMAPPGDEQSAL